MAEMDTVWALRVSNPRPPRCKRGALATELSAQVNPNSKNQIHESGFGIWFLGFRIYELHGKRAAAAAGALGARIADAEAPAVQVVMEIDGDIVEVHQAALVHDDGHAMKLKSLVELGVHGRVEIELVLEAAAAAADHPHAQVDLFRRGAIRLLFADDPLDFTGRFFGERDSHNLSFSLCVNDCLREVFGQNQS